MTPMMQRASRDRFARARRLLCMAAMGCAWSGCAFMAPENRPLLSAMDRAIRPTDPWATVALTPLMIPVGLTAGVADVALLHPAAEVAPSARRIHGRYFVKPNESGARRALLFIPRHFIAGPDFVALWILESFFDFPNPPLPFRPPQARRAPLPPEIELRTILPEEF